MSHLEANKEANSIAAIEAGYSADNQTAGYCMRQARDILASTPRTIFVAETQEKTENKRLAAQYEAASLAIQAYFESSGKTPPEDIQF